MKLKLQKPLFAAAVAAACAAPFSGALAARQRYAFKDVDANHDRYVSREEAKGTPQAKDFDKLDKDGDGKLSLWEYHAQAPAPNPGTPRAEGYMQRPDGSGQTGPKSQGFLPH